MYFFPITSENLSMIKENGIFYQQSDKGRKSSLPVLVVIVNTGYQGFYLLGKIIKTVLKQTSRCGEVGFGIWLKHNRKMSKFSVSFEYFPWCLKAKFQIPPLQSVMFAVNTTTRAASNQDYLRFCSSQPLLSPGTVHQNFE